MYTTGQNGLDLIKSFEGLRLQAYYDSVGVITIGWGTTNHVLGEGAIQPGMTITEDVAEQYLRMGLQTFENAVNNMVQVPISQNQFDALVSFSYNVGGGNLQRSGLLRKLNAGDYDGAANEFPKWNMAGGHPLAGLTRRRIAEQQLFNTPDA